MQRIETTFAGRPLVIESGRMAFYVTFEGQSHLVALRLEGGRKQLVTFLGELEALPLPEC